MPALTVTRLPAFEDNYLWLIHGEGSRSNTVAVVDPGDAAVVEAALTAQGLRLHAILVTHHHRDHTGGIEALVARHGCKVYGPVLDPIPGMTHPLHDGDTVDLPELGLSFQVLHVPGHTKGHIAYVGHGALFCGDTLFSGGCGRLFEGTAAQMLHSLDRLCELPDDTLVYCAHEYTASNLKFALVVEPQNTDLVAYAREVTALRARGEATIPARLGREKAINPFLRSRADAVRATVWRELGVDGLSDEDTFLQLREWKNRFR